MNSEIEWGTDEDHSSWPENAFNLLYSFKGPANMLKNFRAYDEIKA